MRRGKSSSLMDYTITSIANRRNHSIKMTKLNQTVHFYLPIYGLLVGIMLFACDKKGENVFSLITEYYSFENEILPSKDSICITSHGNNLNVYFENEQNRDTSFTVILGDSLLFIKDKMQLIPSHNFYQKKITISQFNTSFFTPYLSNNSILKGIRTYRIGSKHYPIHCFLENVIDDEHSSGYSYYLADVGFIAFINSHSKYYCLVKNIEQNPDLNNVELKQLTRLLTKDSSFFINREIFPKLPKEYQ